MKPAFWHPVPRGVLGQGQWRALYGHWPEILPSSYRNIGSPSLQLDFLAGRGARAFRKHNQAVASGKGLPSCLDYRIWIIVRDITGGFHRSASKWISQQTAFDHTVGPRHK